MTQNGDFSAGHVGGPFSCTEISLKDVPEMGYRHTDTWHGADPRDAGGGGVACDGRGEVGERTGHAAEGCGEEREGRVGEEGGWRMRESVVPCCEVAGFRWMFCLSGASAGVLSCGRPRCGRRLLFLMRKVFVLSCGSVSASCS